MKDADHRALAARYRVEAGEGFRLADRDPADEAGLALDKKGAKVLLREGVERLAALQERLYAQDRHAVLAIFQAMDAAGKDGAIAHVFTGVNPQGCQVHAFKAPGAVDLDHDFLRRHVLALPERGRIGIHNRSWYEEVLVARVRPGVLERQKLPAACVGPDLWAERLEDIAAFERYLARQGVVVLKFFLHLSAGEQRLRLLSRIDEPGRQWKFAADDLAERGRWDAYQDAYEAAIRATAAPHAPWFVVPADRKWFTRLVVVEAMTEAMERLDLRFPELDEAARAGLARARAALAG